MAKQNAMKIKGSYIYNSIFHSYKPDYWHAKKPNISMLYYTGTPNTGSQRKGLLFSLKEYGTSCQERKLHQRNGDLVGI